jgi:predicted negative regulator of RcsB-dependent stress response
MATEVKHPTTEGTVSTQVPDRTTAFWNKNSKYIVYGFLALILIVGGYFAYKNFVQLPEERKASEAMFKAEEYFRMDSIQLALNGDASNPGFIKIISKYGGTKAGKLAKFYAGASYLKAGDFNNAIKYLKDFSTEDKLIEVRATGLLGDAYAESGKKKEAADQYKKAGTMYPSDNFNSPEYLFRAGLVFEELGNKESAIEMYSTIKDKYPNSQQGRDIEKYLARLGEYK